MNESLTISEKDVAEGQEQPAQEGGIISSLKTSGQLSRLGDS
ncbi:MAG: hypothetical protein NTZ83_04495 [Candidatus Pacearchaeota archaeon]|nr:hypothetical protein [Candidatus Pacearchaeota archaeon]